MAQALGERPQLARALALAGATFLAFYGARALHRARQTHRLQTDAHGAGSSRGAVVAQAAAFTLLSVGARWLAPWFARPSAWRVLDTVIGATMLLLAALLVRGALLSA